MPSLLCSLLSAGFLDDLHSFDPATMTWTLLSAANDTRRPSARADHGFTSAGGLLYVHGGFGHNEGNREAVCRVYGSGGVGDARAKEAVRVGKESEMGT